MNIKPLGAADTEIYTHSQTLLNHLHWVLIRKTGVKDKRKPPSWFSLAERKQQPLWKMVHTDSSPLSLLRHRRHNPLKTENSVGFRAQVNTSAAREKEWKKVSNSTSREWQKHILDPDH